jgi:HEAT repeat protein
MGGIEMRRRTSSLAAFTLVVAMPGLVSVAFAHGGSYRPPAGEVPPGSREPSDPPPPPDPAGPATPSGDGPTGPTTGGDNPQGPSTPSDGGSGPKTPPTGGGPSNGGGNPTGGVTTNGRGPGAKKAPGYSGWGYWWGYNKDEILQLKSAVWRMHRGNSTANGFGTKSAKGNAIRPVTDRAVAEEVVPALRALLADPAQSFHIRSAAELGLAKIGDEDSIPALRRMAENEGNALHREIEETAALALGLMQRDDAETRAALLEIVTRQAKDGTYVRPFSAISLGLLGERNDRERAVASAFVSVLAQKEPGADIKPACLMGLGLLGNDAAIPDLVAMVKNGKAARPGAVDLNEMETAYAVAALGKIGKAGTSKPGEETLALDEIVRILENERAKTGATVRRSAAIALGQIGTSCAPRSQNKVVDLLKRLAGDAEEQEANFAVMSLGRIGAAKGAEQAVRKEITSFLGKALDKGHGQTPAFAAMALGLVGRGMTDEGGAAPEEDIRAPLRAKFDAGGDPQMRGAYALASGLVRDPLAAERLQKTLNDRGTDKRVRGWCALALGLIGDPSAVESIRTTLKDDADRDLRVQAAMAAGLLGDAGVIGDVVAVLENRDSSNYELGSAALALGQIGDERAISVLVGIAKDATNRYPDLTRALAVVALGQIGDKRDVPVLARVATDVNYRAHVPAITELLTIL